VDLDQQSAAVIVRQRELPHRDDILDNGDVGTWRPHALARSGGRAESCFLHWLDKVSPSHPFLAAHLPSFVAQAEQSCTLAAGSMT
jgi:hypothetical protein